MAWLMAELGDNSESEHRRIGRVAEDLGIQVVGYETVLHGEVHVTGVDEAVALLRTMGPGDAALVKGSRVERLEDVVRAYGVVEDAPPPAPSAAGRHEMPGNKKWRRGGTGGPVRGAEGNNCRSTRKDSKNTWSE